MTTAFPQVAAPLPSAHRHRFGLIKARIDSSHMIRFQRGVLAQMQVLELARHAGAKTVCRCLFCRKDWPTFEEMLLDHDERAMQQQQEKHVWFWWCAEECDPQSMNQRRVEAAARLGMTLDAFRAEEARREAEKLPPLIAKTLGPLSDER